jgi:uncharacterized membrane protein YphA (DoxX/SURF4 family)
MLGSISKFHVIIGVILFVWILIGIIVGRKTKFNHKVMTVFSSGIWLLVSISWWRNYFIFYSKADLILAINFIILALIYPFIYLMKKREKIKTDSQDKIEDR